MNESQKSMMTTHKSALTSKKANFNQEKVIAALLKDASDSQRNLMYTLVSALILAIKIGHALLKVRALIPHGQIQWFIIENFCKPNDVSLRTAERYQLIARYSDALLSVLRSATPELESKTDEEILSRVSISEAYALVKRIAKIEDCKGPPQPKPDANGWATPAWLMALVTEFLGNVDCDPAALETRAELITPNAELIRIDTLNSPAPWKGRAWVNPGIHKVEHSKWVERLTAEFHAGSVEEGLILVPAVTNSKHALLLREFPLAFIRKPIEVSGPQLSTTTIKAPLMIAYVGPSNRYSDFAVSFSKCDIVDVFVPAHH